MIYQNHSGVYAVVMRAKNILLVTKTRGPYIGKYDLPGGRVELGESSLQALSRELYEETGARADKIAPYGICFCRVGYENEGKNFLLYHIGILYTVSLIADPDPSRITANQDTDGFNWYDINMLYKEEVTPFVWHVIESLRKS